MIAHVLTAAALAAALLAASDGNGSGVISGHAGGDSITVGGSTSGSSDSPSSGGDRRYVYQRNWWKQCAGTTAGSWCADGAPAPHTCADGSQAQAPLFAREVHAATGAYLGDWFLVDPGGCPEDGAAPVLTAQEFARLPLAPSPVHLQPGDGRALVHYGVIATSDATAQTLTTTILGTPVTVTATPTAWTWDYGDGTPPRTTTDPGHPYPDTTGAHPYDAPGTYRLTVTTTWSGTYQVAGTGPQRPVDGTATTTSAAITVTVEAAHPQLVTSP